MSPATQAAIGKQLNLGVSGVMLVTVETAAEARAGVAAMRFKSKGGVRPDDVGGAPAIWGMSEAEYRQKADVWPLNPDGELINWTIVESKTGLANLEEIAAVPGIGVLWPGAGTLRGVFSTTDASGKRVLDEAAWEGAIQQVLAACKANKVACGYPGQRRRHRDADEAGLQRVRDELGRGWLQDDRRRAARSPAAPTRRSRSSPSRDRFHAR